MKQAVMESQPVFLYIYEIRPCAVSSVFSLLLYGSSMGVSGKRRTSCASPIIESAAFAGMGLT